MGMVVVFVSLGWIIIGRSRTTERARQNSSQHMMLSSRVMLDVILLSFLCLSKHEVTFKITIEFVIDQKHGDFKSHIIFRGIQEGHRYDI
jgi:hypothetical protein